MFEQLFAIVLPIIIVLAGLILVYALCKELVRYLKVIMDGIDDVFEKNRDKIYLEKELQPLEAYILKLDEEKHAYEIEINQEERKKKDLIYLLAQDIKLPLSKLMVYFDLIQNQSGLSATTKKQLLVKVLDQSLELEEMMNEFFDIARFNLKYAKWNGSYFYLDRILEQMLGQYYYAIETKQMKVKFTCDRQLHLYGDNDKIARVFSDLYRNMIELAQVESDLEIKVINHDDFYEIYLQVTSEHYSRNELKNIFQNFYRLERKEQEKKHILGLSVAKAIVDMHQGMIRAQSTDTTLTMIVMLPKFRKERKDEV